MNRIRQIAATPLVSVERFDHPETEDHVDPEEEMAPGFAINFVESGSLRVFVGRSSWNLSPASIFCTAPGLAYRCEHSPGAPRDSCLTISFGTEPPFDSFEANHWPSPVVPLDNRRAYAKERLVSHLQGPALGLEEIAGEVLEATLVDGASGRPLYRTSQLSWYARRVDRARERLDVEFDRDHTLESLAREAGMSPFHFARVFRELAGVPPHRYLVRRRLEAAAGLLREGLSVTESCYACGFSSLSHFIRSFRSRYRRSPSRFAREECVRG